MTNGECQECAAGNFYSLVKMNTPEQCEKCPAEKAVCMGGSSIGPKKGYWRANNYTQNIIQCLNSDACLGMVPPDNNPEGTCATGYQGILCADCQHGYSRGDSFSCQKCPEVKSNIIKLSLTLLILIVLSVLLIRTTLQGAKELRNVSGIYLKIMMNHI